ncbi:MAG: glycosyl hydrolase [Bacteroidota bacterium]
MTRFDPLRLAPALALLGALSMSLSAFAQQQPVGQGSYALTQPSGTVGPQDAAGRNVVPLLADGFDQPVQTNDFWSSLLFPFFENRFSGPLLPHPLWARAQSEGLQLGYETNAVLAANDYYIPYRPQLTVGVEGLAASETTVKGYGDWTVTARWEDGTNTLEATLGHGLPFVFFERTGGDARIAFAGTPTVWLDDGNVLGVTVNGCHYGIFGPTGSDWEGTGVLTSDLNGASYFSVALLPDATVGTFSRFRTRAYAFVTDTRVAWIYDEATARLRTTYTTTTEAKESTPGLRNETLTALYRHQWLHTETPATDLTYGSPRGAMRLLEGNTFVTDLPFDGVLPSLPDLGAYDRATLRSFVEQAAREVIPINDTYFGGKALGRFARLVHIADQLGMTTQREYLLTQIRRRLQDWFTAGGQQQYVYNATWDVLTGYPAGFGSDTQINDHHFHSAYAIMAAATVAQYDPEWALPENWGGMVNLLIRDAANWDRDHVQFPFLRAFDAYAGHGWASGHGDFPDGNNQESSSESMQFAAATVLWGALTGQQDIRDLGIYLYATEASAIEEYWFDVNDEVFPEAYSRVALGIVWGGKGAHTTWFGNDPEFIHGINILPLTGGSLYLGRHPDFVSRNYDAVVASRGRQPVVWKDILWEYLAFSEPARALDFYAADPNYEPEGGESRAHTLHWLHNLNAMGRVDTTVTANVPTAAVFRDEEGVRTYVALNPGDSVATVTFSDGSTLDVPARELASERGTGVGTEDTVGVPEQFAVLPNVPNPFASRTTIRYTLPAPTTVTLRVYDLLGRTVYETTEAATQAGTHAVEIDARTWPSGVYVAEVETEREQLTLRMTLAR